MLHEPISEASAWTTAELEADPNWRQQLTEREAREFVDAARAVQARGLEVGGFGREDFPLPSAAARIDALVDNVENGRGVSLLRGFPIQGLDAPNPSRAPHP